MLTELDIVLLGRQALLDRVTELEAEARQCLQEKLEADNRLHRSQGKNSTLQRQLQELRQEKTAILRDHTDTVKRLQDRVPLFTLILT